MTPVSPDEFERLVRIETKLDIIITNYQDHETRIRKLERALWVAIGAAGLAGGVVGQLITPLIGG